MNDPQIVNLSRLSNDEFRISACEFKSTGKLSFLSTLEKMTLQRHISEPKRTNGNKVKLVL